MLLLLFLLLLLLLLLFFIYITYVVFQRTLVPVVTDVSATVVVNAAIVIDANVAAVNVATIVCCY
jgi:hypothetical protein